MMGDKNLKMRNKVSFIFSIHIMRVMRDIVFFMFFLLLQKSRTYQFGGCSISVLIISVGQRLGNVIHRAGDFAEIVGFCIFVIINQKGNEVVMRPQALRFWKNSLLG